jgi:NAD(P)-dependent dehydrogenase (short-subunit alcohol dehydrogenase family)
MIHDGKERTLSTDAKVALVTGASKGVGKGIALGLAKAGFDVAINFNSDREGAEQTAQEVRQLGRRSWIVQGDVGNQADVDRVFAELRQLTPALDVLVNNSGVQTWASLFDLTEKDWDRTIRTNLKGSFLCTQAAGRWMRETGGGSIINIGSGANKAPVPNLIDYCASKGGIDQLTRVTAVELGPFSIRVNCVAPGAIEIERTRLENPDYAKTWGTITPLRRVGNVDDVANAVIFFASDVSTFVTGQTLYVDGGLWTRGVWPYETS